MGTTPNSIEDGFRTEGWVSNSVQFPILFKHLLNVLLLAMLKGAGSAEPFFLRAANSKLWTAWCSVIRRPM
jgi:hypothetical protein